MMQHPYLAQHDPGSGIRLTCPLLQHLVCQVKLPALLDQQHQILVIQQQDRCLQRVYCPPERLSQQTNDLALAVLAQVCQRLHTGTPLLLLRHRPGGQPTPLRRQRQISLSGFQHALEEAVQIAAHVGVDLGQQLCYHLPDDAAACTASLRAGRGSWDGRTASLLTGRGGDDGRFQAADGSLQRGQAGDGVRLWLGQGAKRSERHGTNLQGRCPPPGSARNAAATLKERLRPSRSSATLAPDYWLVRRRQEGGCGGQIFPYNELWPHLPAPTGVG